MTEETSEYLGRCNVCGSWSRFVKEGRSIRETYVCHTCRASLRYRGQAEAILRHYGVEEVVVIADLVRSDSFRRLSIFEPGLAGPFREYFAKLPGYRQSLYLDSLVRGASGLGVECQDLMALTYPDNSFDLVITSDIMEHVRRPWMAFGEIQRVLKPGGRHIFSIPVTAPIPERTIFRVDTSTDEDIYLVEPHFHGDGRGGRSLVYSDFGADLIDKLGKIGFLTDAVQLDTPYPDLRRLLTFVSVKADAAPLSQQARLHTTGLIEVDKTPSMASVPAFPRGTATFSRSAERLVRCNICGQAEFGPGPGGRMSRTGRPPQCMHCKAMERHRVVRRVFEPLATPELTSFTALQFSNDISIRREWFGRYEISVYRGENSMDLEAIPRADESYDAIICNHVLEHVSDDREALRELFRVISRRGFILITVPNPLTNRTTRSWGYPDAKMHGHYRTYGADIVRLFAEVLPGALVHAERDFDPVTHVEDIVYFIAKTDARIADIRSRISQARTAGW